MIFVSPQRVKLSPLLLLLVIILLPVVLVCAIILFLLGFVLTLLATLYYKITGKASAASPSFYQAMKRYQRYAHTKTGGYPAHNNSSSHTLSASARVTDAEFEVIETEKSP